jgi:hypothetical protein
MPKVYAFDVDETIEVSGGPVTLASMMDLRVSGAIVGLCGNLNAFCTRVTGWQHLISFTLNLDLYPVIGAGLPKDIWLRVFRQTTFPNAEEYIMVGNILGVSGASDDKGAAERAGWRFIQESEFAKGVR